MSQPTIRFLPFQVCPLGQQKAGTYRLFTNVIATIRIFHAIMRVDLTSFNPLPSRMDNRRFQPGITKLILAIAQHTGLIQGGTFGNVRTIQSFTLIIRMSFNTFILIDNILQRKQSFPSAIDR